MEMMFEQAYAGKRVLVTGHTGFKGSWLTTWLLKLGATVAGFSDCVPTEPSMFEKTGLAENIEHHLGDVRDLAAVTRVIEAFKPDFVFHLAAQAIVSTSYSDPVGTITTNVVGTANVLEALRLLNPNCVAIMITSDKCYENVEWVWGYKETDHLGGRDIYSGSKGAAEVIMIATQSGLSRRSASSTLAVPITLVVMVPSGSLYEVETIACAARWKTKSGRNSPITRLTVARSRSSCGISRSARQSRASG